MTSDSQPRYLEALRALAAALDESRAPWTLLGGAAVLALGVPRHTADIDATVLGGDVTVAALLDLLGQHGITPRIEHVVEFARENQVLLLEHAPSAIPIDLSLAWLPFEEEAVAAARRLDFAGVVVPIPRPEDLVIYKLIALRPRDVEDAERLVVLHGASIDGDRVRAVLVEVCAALEDDARLEVFDRLWATSAGRPSR